VKYAALVLCAVLVVAAPGAAANLFVSPTGSGSDCSQVSPCQLGVATVKVVAGDTLTLAAGTYTSTAQQVIVLWVGATVQGGWNGAATGAIVVDPKVHVSVIDGENARRGISLLGGSPVVRGLTIRRGNATGRVSDCSGLDGQPAGCGGGIFAAQASPTIESTVIEDCVASGATPGGMFGVGGGIAVVGGRPVVRNNVIRRCTASTDSAGRGGGVALVAAEPGSLVEGNEITGNAAGSSEGIGGGVYLRGGAVTVARNLLEANDDVTAAPPGAGAALYVEEGTPAVEGNTVVGNRGNSAVFIVAVLGGSATGNRIVGNHAQTALDLGGSLAGYTFVIANNVISDGWEYNLKLMGGTAGGTTVDLVHNTLAGNGYNTGIVVSFGTSVAAANNVLAGHWLAIDDRGGAVVAMTRTLFWRNKADGLRGDDALDGNPNFVDPLARDFHLRPGSAAIDAAVAAAVPVAADIDGQARPAAPAQRDIGADELPPTRFDCGTPTSPVEVGYTRLTEADRFSPGAGLGWLSGTVGSRNRGAGTALTRDFAFANAATFALALPAGLYDVTLTLGDTAYPHDQMRISIEGEAVDTISTAKGQIVTRTWRRRVDDGALTLALKDDGGTDASVVVNAIEVRDPAVVKLDFGTATSPVAPGFTRVDHATAFSAERGFGWLSGAVASRDRGTADPRLRDFCLTKNATFRVVPPDDFYSVILTTGDATWPHDQMRFAFGWQAHTVSTAAGEHSTETWALTAGPPAPLDLTIEDVGGTDANAVINALEVSPMPQRRFDLGTPTSPLAPGYTRVTPASAYRPAIGYGWTAGAVAARDRGTADPVRRDFVFARQATFVVDVPCGLYQTQVVLGDATVAHDLMRITIEGDDEGTYSTIAGQLLSVNGRYRMVEDGQITVVLEDLGGTDVNAAIAAIIIH
jgi:fibronectin type 3 domain-containing protein